MGFEATPSTLALVATVLVSVPVASVVRSRSHGRGGTSLVVLLASAGVWAGTVLAVEIAGSYGAATWWLRLSYAAGGVTVLAWFVFVLEYTGRGRLVSNSTVAALTAEPVVISLLAWSNGAIVPMLDPKTLFDSATGRLVIDPALGFWIHELYLGLLLFCGAVLLGSNVYRSRDLTRRQVGAIAVGIVAPLATTLPYGLGVTRVELTPVGIVLAGGSFAYVVCRYDLVEIAPVAHDTIVENIRDGVFVLDRRDRVVEINPMAKRILGIEGDRVVGSHAREALSVYPGLYDRYEDISEVQEEIGLDDGERRRFFHIQVSPLFDRGERSVGRLFLIHEITDQKRRQRQLERQNQRLDQFASLVSHDLRNPLNVADGFVELAQDTGDTDYLDRVADSLDRMDHLIDDVLSLARHGQTITETKDVDVEAVAREAWDNVETADATVSIEGGAPIDADSDRLLRVFENLYRNAIEHAGEDVAIRVGRLGSDGTDSAPECRGFFVEDDGPGIDEENRDEVLEDGFSTSDDGLGLGLSIVTSIVEAHGWDIDVTASREGGARFEVTGVEPAGTRDQQPARPGGE